MRDKSGGGKSSNNAGNPGLRDAEREKGVSGAAVHGEKLKNASPKRGSVRESSP